MIEYTVPLYLAATSRLHGSSSPTPKLLEAALYAVPYTVLVYLYTNGWYILPCLIACAAAKNIGTAEGFKDYTRDNWLSRITGWMTGEHRNTAWGDAVYNGLKGSLISALPAVIIAAYSPQTAAAIFLASAVGLPLGYHLGYLLRCRFEWLRKRYNSYVPIAEWLTGFFAGLGFLF